MKIITAIKAFIKQSFVYMLILPELIKEVKDNEEN